MNEETKIADEWKDDASDISDTSPAIEAEALTEILSFVAGLAKDGEDIAELHKRGFISDDEHKEWLSSTEKKTETPLVEEPEVKQEDKPPVVDDKATSVGLSDEETKTLKESSDNWNRWVTEFSADPVKAVAAIVGNPNAFTPEQRAKLAGYVGANVTPPVNPTTIEPSSPYEELALPHADWVTKGRNEVEQAFGQVSSNLRDMYVEQTTTKLALEQLSRLFDVSLPKIDLKEIYKPNTDIQKNIETLYGAKLKEAVDKALSLRKAANTPKPSTPKGVSGGVSTLGKPTTIQDSLKQVEAMLASNSN